MLISHTLGRRRGPFGHYLGDVYRIVMSLSHCRSLGTAVGLVSCPDPFIAAAGGLHHRYAWVDYITATLASVAVM